MKKLLPFLLVIVLSYAEFRTLWFIQEKNIGMTYYETMYPLQGIASWRAHQNRLLAGYTIQKVIEVTGAPQITSYQIFGFISLMITNLIAFVMFKRKFLYLIAFIAAFLVLQDPLYFYGWDYLDLLVFTLLAYGITTHKGIIFFTLLFIVGIFNRESAIFIPLWMCIDSFFKQKRDWIGFSYGLFLTGAGIFTVKFLRDTLFIQSHSEINGLDMTHKTIGNHFYLFDNIASMGRLVDPIVFVPFIAIALISFKAWKDGLKIEDLKIVLFIFLFMVSIICFALVGEMRVWLPLIPICLMYLLQKDFRRRENSA